MTFEEFLEDANQVSPLEEIERTRRRSAQKWIAATLSALAIAAAGLWMVA